MSTSVAEIGRKIRERERLLHRLSGESFRYYLDAVRIAASPEPLRFGAVAEPWQRDILRPLIPAVEFAAGFNPGYWSKDAPLGTTGKLSFATILPRGHDKSSLEGRIASWLLGYSRVPIRGYIVAKDGDQGELILQAMQDEARLNPWIARHLNFKSMKVTGPGGWFEVLPADSGSAYGLRGNVYIVDELTNWDARGQKMWTAVISGREKVPGALLMLLSNAGVQETWQWEIREAISAHADWEVFERQGQLASWMTKERVDGLRALLPPSEAARLYDNEWVDPATEFDYLRRTEVEACEALGVALGLTMKLRRDPWTQNYVASIDYGARRDRTALSVVHVAPDGVVHVDRLDVWQGRPDDPVQIPRVEAWVDDILRQFAPQAWVVDPANLEGTVQMMERRGLPVERFEPRGGKSNYELAQHLRALVVNRRLAWYGGAGDLLVTNPSTGITKRETFGDELRGLRVKRMPYGYRFDHENQKHDDRAVAVGMASLRAVQYANKHPVPAPSHVLSGTDPGYLLGGGVR